MELFSKKIVRLICSLLVVFSVYADWQHNAASVLPRIKTSDGIYYVLAREAFGPDKGTYEDFGGRRDPDENSLATASREFYEEAIISHIFGRSLTETRMYVEKHGKKIPMQSKKYVTYITPFDKKFWSLMRKNFFKARQQATGHQFKEKDVIALIKEDDLYRAMRDNGDPTKRKVSAELFFKDSSVGKKQKIFLRPIFVYKLQGYFKNHDNQELNKQLGDGDVSFLTTSAPCTEKKVKNQKVAHSKSKIAPRIFLSRNMVIGGMSIVGIGSVCFIRQIQISRKQLNDAYQALLGYDRARALTLVQDNWFLCKKTKQKLRAMILSHDADGFSGYIKQANKSRIFLP